MALTRPPSSSPESSILLSFFLLLILRIASSDSACSSTHERPQFYEENYARQDFALIGEPKDMALCRVTSEFDGCPIEWYKDGQIIKASMHISFFNNDQILSITTVKLSDAGVYSCRVYNDGGEISRNLTLSLYEDSQEAPFNMQWSSCNLKNTTLGGNVSATCKFVDYTDPLDNSCTWYKRNDTAPVGSEDEWKPLFAIDDLVSDDSFCAENTSYPLCGQLSHDKPSNVLFMCLNLYNLREKHYGEYRLTINSEVELKFNLYILFQREDQSFQFTVILAVVFSIIGVVLLTTILWQIFKTDVKLILHNTSLGKQQADTDGKLYDAYISHASSDFDMKFVTCLKNRLEEKGYKIFLPEVDLVPGGCTVEQIGDELRKSRRFIMVLSPEYIDANNSAFEAASFVEGANRYKKEIISILFKNSEIENQEIRTILKHIMKVSKVVKWCDIKAGETSSQQTTLAGSTSHTSYIHVQEDSTAVHTRSSKEIEKTFKSKVFKELLLGMPPQPKSPNGINSQVAMNNIGKGNGYPV